MANIFKNIDPADVQLTRTKLHEHIPVTGALVSGTYGGNGTALGSEPHIRNYSHGMFSSVYDYPYLSSSANHIIDISVGFSAGVATEADNPNSYWLASGLSGSTDTGDTTVNHSIGVAVQQEKKINMYNQMCQLLSGYDIHNNIANFDQDGTINNAAEEAKMNAAVFLSFSRMLVKDEIKKGSFAISLGVSASYSGHGGTAGDSAFQDRILITDTNAQNSFFTTSPAGEFGVLYADTQTSNAVLGTDNGTQKVGLIYYQAGIAVLTSSIFQNSGTEQGFHVGNAVANPKGKAGDFGVDRTLHPGILNIHSVSASLNAQANGTPYANFKGEDFVGLLTGSTIANCAHFVRSRISNIQFNNTTELNSQIVFCRAHANEFNYSSNRTYLTGSKIRVKNEPADSPRSYMTTVGLYSSNNELMAVAKLSEPLRKDPEQEVTLRVRLDY